MQLPKDRIVFKVKKLKILIIMSTLDFIKYNSTIKNRLQRSLNTFFNIK